MRVAWFAAAWILMAVPSEVRSQSDIFTGPYYGDVVRVIDGDNFEAEIDIWPTVQAVVSVRIRGLDAPEIFRPACLGELVFGNLARRSLEAELFGPDGAGVAVRLENVRADSFSGRIVADVFRQNESRGTNLRTQLLRRGIVREWIPSRPAIDWCVALPGAR